MIKQKLIVHKDCFCFYVLSHYSTCYISAFLETCSHHTGKLILMTYITK